MNVLRNQNGLAKQDHQNVVTNGTENSEKIVQESNGLNVEELPDRIAEVFSGKKIFLTGGTGFVGKCILEKLLRRCPDIGHIYLLARPKKGKVPKQRFEEIVNGNLFELVRKMYDTSDLNSKVTVFEGDIAAKGYSLTAADLEIITKADIIIHGAASIRFDDTLKESIILNARGTKYLLEIAKQFSKLELLVYISTAFCHPEQPVLEEKIYPSKYDPEKMIDLLEWIDDDMLKAITPIILRDIPNTYTLSKSLAETLIDRVSDEMPTLILRPSVVVPIMYEPALGWSDNLNGPGGMLLAAGRGILRTAWGNETNHLDFIPVDIFVNVSFIGIWNYLKNGDRPRVIHVTSTDEVQLSWMKILDIGKEIVSTTIPFNNAVWHPGGYMSSSKVIHKTRAFLFHWIPAILVDTLLICLGIKPVLVDVHRRIHKGFEVLEYYIKNQWTFKSKKLQDMRKLLNKRERMLYKTDSDGFDFESYLANCILHLRRNKLKQSDEMLPAARRHLRMLKYLDKIVSSLFWLLVVYWVFKLCNLFF